MLSRGYTGSSESTASVSSSATGLFRGLLSNVSSTVAGTGSSLSVLEARNTQLQHEISVLQDELESKILENERLVMESSEVRRSKHEAELRVEGIEAEIIQARQAAASAGAEVSKVESEKNELNSMIESYEIQVDELRREILFQQEASKRTHSLTELLEARLTHMTNHSADVEAELKQTKSVVASTETRLAQTQRSLELSEAERLRHAHEVLQEKAKSQTLILRVSQLEEELSIASLQTSVSVTPYADESVPACGGDPVPCCYRAEHFRDKYKAIHSDLQRLQEKLR